MKRILLPMLLVIIQSNMITAQWTQLNSGTTQNLNELFFPVTDTGYVVGNNGTVLKTTDGGINWSNLNTGLNLNFNELYFLSAQEGWLVGDSGCICYTSNGGVAWNCSFLDSAEYINLHSVFALNSNNAFIGGQFNVSDGYIAKTTNNGTSWQLASIERYIWDVNIKKLGMINDSVGYAAARGFILKTIDYGTNWYITDTASVYATEMFHLLEDIAFFPDNDTVYVCGWYGEYFGKTFNAGDAWLHNNDYQSYNLDFINTQTGYIGGWGQVHKTTDGGATFVDASGGSNALLYDIYSIDFVNEWTGYACGYGGKILKTSNGGTTSTQEHSHVNSDIIIYPNPVNDLINFSVKTNVQLANVAGQIVAERKNITTLDLSNQTSGIYLLILTDNNGQVIQRHKIVKE